MFNRKEKYKKSRTAFTVLFLFFTSLNCFTQSYTIEYKILDTTLHNIQLKKIFSTKKNCEDYIQQIPTYLKSNGFLSSSIDSIISNNNSFKVIIFLGKKYTFKTLNLSSELNEIVRNESIEKIPETLLNHFQNHGYPFASIEFDSVDIKNDNEIKASLKIDKGIEYKLDSIRLFGEVNVSNNFLWHYLNLPTKSLFNNSLLEKIDEKLNKLSFLQTTKPTEILMLNSGYVINIFAAPKKANRFDIIFGLLPNNNQTNGDLLLTVDANIGLVNAFAKAEKINISWQQIQPQSPRIEIGFNMPYIFKTNAQLDYRFNLYKRDSSFLNINNIFGLTYDIADKSKFSISLNTFSSKLITPDTQSIIATKKLPSILDLSITNIGLEYSFDNTFGTTINKQKGFELRLNTSFGQKNILPNTTITSLKTGGFNYNKLYDSVQKSTYQIKAKLMAVKYFKLSKYSILKTQLNAAIIQSSQIFQNEQFQIGGFKLLRGFDEENIFTNKYLVNSFEYRYLINSNSFFYFFNDIGFSGNEISGKNYNYVSGGLGLALKTKQGVLNFCIAAGKRDDLPFNFRETKIHIGLVSGL